jgi:hypothetical protein
VVAPTTTTTRNILSQLSTSEWAAPPPPAEVDLGGVDFPTFELDLGGTCTVAASAASVASVAPVGATITAPPNALGDSGTEQVSSISGASDVFMAQECGSCEADACGGPTAASIIATVANLATAATTTSATTTTTATASATTTAKPVWTQLHPDCTNAVCGDASCKQGKGSMVSAETARLAVEHAALQGAIAGASLATSELRAKHAEEMADVHYYSMVDGLSYEVMMEAQQSLHRQALGALASAKAAALQVLDARIATLQQQLGGSDRGQTVCWLTNVGAKRAAEAKAKDAEAKISGLEAKVREYSDLRKVGPKLQAKGDALLNQLSSKAAIATARLQADLRAPIAERATDVGLSDRRIDQLAEHLEAQLFGAGGGDVARTKLLAAALFRRPAVQKLLAQQDARTERLRQVISKMVESAAGVLGHLTTGKRGSRTREDHEHFESIVAALTPDDAESDHMMSTIAELLGIHHRVVERAVRHRRQANEDGKCGAFSNATKVSRKKYKSFNAAGRQLCREYWHSDATRFDTNARKKRRIKRIAANTYIEHWRRIQYDTNQQMFDGFKRSAVYNSYLAAGGKPISESIFFQEKCRCIVKADHEECACPLCTQMHELLRDWDRQRKGWHEAATTPCTCGACAPDSAYRKASKGLDSLNDLLLCPREVYPSLQINSGPHSQEEVKMRRRQCCKAPLLESHGGSRSGDVCDACGFDNRMPRCPIEFSTADPAEWKEYQPRGPGSSGGNQEDLVTVHGTRAEMMDRLAKIYALWLPHHWIKRWCEHQRHLTYATFGVDEACISTDFSAVYDHKAFCSRCCEQPHHSNMDVFVVT